MQYSSVVAVTMNMCKNRHLKLWWIKCVQTSNQTAPRVTCKTNKSFTQTNVCLYNLSFTQKCINLIHTPVQPKSSKNDSWSESRNKSWVKLPLTLLNNNFYCYCTPWNIPRACEGSDHLFIKQTKKYLLLTTTLTKIGGDSNLTTTYMSQSGWLRVCNEMSAELDSCLSGFQFFLSPPTAGLY